MWPRKGDKNASQTDGRRLLDHAMARRCAAECSLAACSFLVSKEAIRLLGFVLTGVDEMKATANESEFGQRLRYLKRTGLVDHLVTATTMNDSYTQPHPSPSFSFVGDERCCMYEATNRPQR